MLNVQLGEFSQVEGTWITCTQIKKRNIASIPEASQSPPVPPRIITILTSIISFTCSWTSSEWNPTEGIVSDFFCSHYVWESHLCYMYLWVVLICCCVIFHCVSTILLICNWGGFQHILCARTFFSLQSTRVHDEQRQGLKWRDCLSSQRNVDKAWGCAPNQDCSIHILLKNHFPTGSNKGNLRRGEFKQKWSQPVN